MTRDEIESTVREVFDLPQFDERFLCVVDGFFDFAEAFLQLVEQKRWRPIETAPKSTLVDCWYVDVLGKGHRYPNAMFENGFWWVWEITNGEVKMKNASALNFTHWQPLPNAPEVKS